MLQLTAITKRYGDDVLALKGVDLSVASGEIICLLGPSGCGKTTLLRIIAGLELADSGTIELASQDLSRVPVHERHFGYMFQDFALFPHKSVAENIAFGLRMKNMARDRIDNRVDEMLALVGLSGYGARSVFELSGGERQRVALARSLAPNPRLVMLDEPLGSLDRTLRESLSLELRSILKQVDVTAIYVTHDQEEAFTIADRIAVMMAGKIVQIDTPQMIYAQPSNAAVARFLGLNALLPIRLSESDSSRVETALGAFDSALLPSPVPSEGGLLLIRPDSARIVESPISADVAYPYLQPQQDQRGETLRLTAYLEDVSFRGSQNRLVVRMPTAPAPTTLAFDVPVYQSSLQDGALRRASLPDIGKPIVLTIFPDLTTVLPD